MRSFKEGNRKLAIVRQVKLEEPQPVLALCAPFVFDSVCCALGIRGGCIFD